ncbi:hypothetical protein ACP4OV_012653 [Aristida adscensionis]
MRHRPSRVEVEEQETRSSDPGQLRPYLHHQTENHLAMSRDSQDNGSRTYHGIERSKGLAAPCNSIMEDDLDSTASTPPCPVVIGPEQPPTLPIARTEYQQSKTKLTGANKRARYRVPETSGQI